MGTRIANILFFVLSCLKYFINQNFKGHKEVICEGPLWKLSWYTNGTNLCYNHQKWSGRAWFPNGWVKTSENSLPYTSNMNCRN